MLRLSGEEEPRDTATGFRKKDHRNIPTREGEQDKEEEKEEEGRFWLTCAIIICVVWFILNETFFFKPSRAKATSAVIRRLFQLSNAVIKQFRENEAAWIQLPHNSID